MILEFGNRLGLQPAIRAMTDQPKNLIILSQQEFAKYEPSCPIVPVINALMWNHLLGVDRVLRPAHFPRHILRLAPCLQLLQGSDHLRLRVLLLYIPSSPLSHTNQLSLVWK